MAKAASFYGTGRRKSSVARVYLFPGKGNITINNQHINYKISDEIGFLTEERSLLTKMTVYDQIIYYGTLKSIPEDEIIKRLDYWLDRFEISEYKYKKINRW